MKSNFPIALCLLATFTFSQKGRSAPVDLSKPQNMIGYADRNGHLRYFHKFGTIQFSDDFSLPFRFDFSSAPGRLTAHSEYGWRGWSCGVLESRAELIDGGAFLRVRLLCAKVFHLKRVGDKDRDYRSNDGVWRGHVSGEHITIFRDDGWALHYEENKIAKIETDMGKQIVWARDKSGFLESIQETGTDEQQLSIEWAKGHTHIISIKTTNGNYNFSIINSDILEKITWLDSTGRNQSFSSKQGDHNLTLTSQSKEILYFAWKKQSGEIQHDGINSYVFKTRKVIEGAGTEKFSITMKSPDGGTISREIGGEENETIRIDPDGRKVIVIENNNEGPLKGSISRVELLSDKDAKKIVLLANFYDEEGKIKERLWYGSPFKFKGYHHGIIEQALLPDKKSDYMGATILDDVERKHLIEFEYDDSGRHLGTKVEGEDVLAINYDMNGDIVNIRLKGRFERRIEDFDVDSESEILIIPEMKDGPFWYLDSKSKGVTTNLVIKETRTKDGDALSRLYADGRVTLFARDTKGRLLSESTIAPDATSEIRLTEYYYDSDGKDVVRVSTDFLLGKTKYVAISASQAGFNIRGRYLPPEVAKQRILKYSKNNK